MWSQFTVICLPFNRIVQQFSSCMPCTKLLQLLVHLTMLKSSAMSLVQPLPCRTVKNVTCMLSVVITSAVVPLIRILHAELRTVQLAVRRATRRAELHKLKSGVLGILQHNLDTLVQKLQRSHYPRTKGFGHQNPSCENCDLKRLQLCKNLDTSKTKQKHRRAAIKTITTVALGRENLVQPALLSLSAFAIH